MELDELKQGWNRSAGNIQTSSRDIRSIITHKENGPVTKLRNRFRKAMIVVTVVSAIAISRIPHHHSLASHLLLPFLLVFALFMLVYFYYNYKLLGGLLAMDVTVKENLQKQVRVLEKGVHFRLIFTRAMAVVFMVLMEILMYRGEKLSGWYDKPLTTRIMVYAIVFAVFYLLTHQAVKHRYSQNISRLKELVNELE